MALELIEKTINSYPCYFINTKKGNSLALTFNVMAGSWSDRAGEFPGRAHLWEHVIHLGSKKYPNQLAFDQKLEELGVDYNAYTSLNRTFYYGQFHPDALEGFCDLLGATISAPVCEEAAFENEKKVVMNEVAEYRATGSEALEAALFLLCAPKNHPLRMFYIGLPDDLKKTSLKDVMDFYKTFYRPQKSQIILAGNFAEFSTEKAAQLLEQNFFKGHQPAGSCDEVVLGSLFDESSHRWVDLSTKEETHLARFLFELPGQWVKKNAEFAEILFEYLNLEVEGSISHFLEEKGYISHIQFSWHHIQNLELAEVQVELTDLGFDEFKDFSQCLFDRLVELQTNPLEETLFDFLRSSVISAHLEEIQDSRKAADYLGDCITRGVPVQKAFQIEERYGQVKTNELKNSNVRLFEPGKWRLGRLSPKIKADQEFKDFERQYRIDASNALISELDNILKTVPEAVSALNILNQKYSAPVRDDYADQEWRVLSELTQRSGALIFRPQNDTTQSSIVVGLQYFPNSSHEDICLGLAADCFEDEFRDLCGFLEGKNIYDNFRYHAGRFEFLIKGNPRENQTALLELLDLFFSFDPSEEVFRRSKELWHQHLIEQEQDFSAIITNREVIDRLHRYRFSVAERKAALHRIDYPDFVATWVKIKNQFSGQMSAVGPYPEEQLIRLFEDGVDSKAKANHQLQLAEEFFESRLFGRTEHRVFTEAKEASAFGVSAIQKMSTWQDENLAGLFMLQNLLSLEVFQLNRSINELGYIHNCDLVWDAKQSYLRFYGQTEGQDNLNKTLEGWGLCIKKIQGFEFEEGSVSKIWAGLIRNREILPIYDWEWAKRGLHEYLVFGEFGAYDELTQRLRDLRLDTFEGLKSFREQIAVLDFESPRFQIFGSRQKPQQCL